MNVPSYEQLLAENERLREEGRKDYEGMREFQQKYIAADQELRKLRAELDALRSSMAFRTSLIGRVEAERDALRALVVMRFDHDYPPQFTQGHDLHELTEPVTAEHCRWFVAEIERLRTDCDALRAKIEAAENDAAHQKALADSALRVAEGWERKCGELRAEVIYWKEQKEPGAAGWRALARILRAKIEVMERQEPVGKFTQHPSNGLWEQDGYGDNPDARPLYALPGAKGE